VFLLTSNPQGSFTLERSEAERSKDHNTATAVTTKLQRNTKRRCFTEQKGAARGTKVAFPSPFSQVKVKKKDQNF